MNALSVAWLTMGGSFCVVLVLATGFWLQWMHSQQYKAEANSRAAYRASATYFGGSSIKPRQRAMAAGR